MQLKRELIFKKNLLIKEELTKYLFNIINTKFQINILKNMKFLLLPTKKINKKDTYL